MDKIKNILNPGAKQDNETMYQSGTGDGMQHLETFTGEGNRVPASSGAQHVPGAYDNDASSTTAIKSGVPGHVQQDTALTGGSTTGGPHSSNLANKIDPRVDSTLAGSQSAGGVSNTGTTGSTFPDQSATTTGAAGFSSGNTTAGPHSSDLANKVDPRVDSDLSGSQNTTTGTGNNHHYGRDTAAVGGLGAAGYEAEQHHHNQTSANVGTSSTTTTTTTGPHNSSLLNKVDPRVDSNLDGSNTIGSNTGTSGYQSQTASNIDPNAGTAAHGHHGRDAALVGGVGAAGYEAEKHHHNQTSANAGTSSTTTGPHNSSLLNKVDPRVDTTTGYQTQTTSNVDPNANTSTHGHHGRDAALVGGVGAAGYEAEKHHHNQTSANAGASSTTTGPHNSSLLNKADPRVDSNLDGSNTIGSNTGTSGYQSQTASNIDPNASTATHSHHGRDAALVGGAGAAGVGAHEAHRHDGTSSTGERTTLTGPVHNSSILNKLDPRVKEVSTTHGLSSTDPNTNFASKEHDPVGMGYTGTGPGPNVDSTGSSKDHHYGRDAALGAGAVGVGHEAAKHHHNKDSTTSDPYDSTTHTGHGHKDHHTGRDAALGAGAVGVAGHEHNKNEEKHHGGLQGLLHHDKHDKDDGTHHHKNHHGAEAAAVGGVGAAGVGAHEHHKHEESDRNRLQKEPPAGAQGFAQGDGIHSTGVPQDKSHHGAEAAALGGAGAVGLGEHEHHKHARHGDAALAQENQTGAGYSLNSGYNTHPIGTHTNKVTGLPVDPARGTVGFGAGDILHGGQSHIVPGHRDIDPASREHDPAGMGYGELPTFGHQRGYVGDNMMTGANTTTGSGFAGANDGVATGAGHTGLHHQHGIAGDNTMSGANTTAGPGFTSANDGMAAGVGHKGLHHQHGVVGDNTMTGANTTTGSGFTGANDGVATGVGHTGLQPQHGAMGGNTMTGANTTTGPGFTGVNDGTTTGSGLTGSHHHDGTTGTTGSTTYGNTTAASGI